MGNRLSGRAWVIPPPGVVRGLTIRSVVYAIGNGVFQAGSAVFFTQLLGLTAAQVGIGLSIAGATAIVCSIPVGVLIDWAGARRMWIGAGLVEAAFFFAYPLVSAFPTFVLVASVIVVTDMTASTARDVYTMEIIPSTDRVQALAYQRSALNVGFTLGAALAGVALAIGTPTAYRSLVLANAVIALLATLFVLRMPRNAASAEGRPRTGIGRALGDRPFVALGAVNGVLMAHNSLLVVVLPLWILMRTDAPKVLVPILFFVNTMLCVVFQVRASRGAQTAIGAGQAMRRSGVVLAACCVIFYASTWTQGWTTIVVLAAGTAVLTVGELTQSAGAWGITATLPPPARRGEYIGVFKLGRQAQQTLAPAGLTMLAMVGGGWGWLFIAVLLLAAGYAAPKALAWALRTPRLGTTEPSRSALGLVAPP